MANHKQQNRLWTFFSRRGTDGHHVGSVPKTRRPVYGVILSLSAAAVLALSSPASAADKNHLSPAISKHELVKLPPAPAQARMAGGKERDRFERYWDERAVQKLFDRVEKLSSDEIAQMDHGEVLRIMQELQRLDARLPETEQFTEQRKATIHKIYSASGMDPDFIDYYAPHRAAWHDWVKNDPSVKAYKAGWQQMEWADQKAVLEWILEWHSYHFGFTAAKIELISREDRGCAVDDKRDECDFSFNAHFSPSESVIRINKDHLPVVRHYFDDALSVMVHENTHNHQWQLAKMYRAGDLKPGDPRYNQAGLFFKNWRKDYYASGKNGYRVYQSQWLERHSFWTQRNLRAHYPDMSFSRNYSISISPPAVTKKRPASVQQNTNVQRPRP